MALSPIMKRGVRRVADILGAYARRNGWWPLDFRLYYRVSTKWGRIHFVFVSDGFEGRDELESYESVMAYLKGRLVDDPDLYQAVGLVIETFRQLEEGGIYSIGEESHFIRPRDLFARAIREVATLVVKYATDRGWRDHDYRIFYREEPAGADKVGLIVHVKGELDGDGPAEADLRSYIASRLFDEPEILYTINLEIESGEAIDAEKVRGELASGYKDYFAFSRA